VSVVVFDTSPLHYLILCGAENILPRLFQQVVMPPAVFNELQQANTPPLVRQWAATQGCSKVRPVERRSCSAALKSEDRRPKSEFHRQSGPEDAH